MRIEDTGNGFTIWLSRRDTYNWAHRSGAVWPGSYLSGRRLVAQYDRGGLCDLTIDGRYAQGYGGGDLESSELKAIVSDHAILPNGHPCGCYLD